ncbi:MAG: exodeoxyribonuclease VII large subunit [Deltaproteobacteria bacterium]|nr:exodeoxyribonuclease VII large subunit [Deltaproteobacteria bacterium]
MLSDKKILTVYELTNYISMLLDEGIGYVYVRGEVSNLRVSDVGHAYFTIKDDKSQISAVLFRGQNIKINFKDGNRIIVGGMVSVYPPRGIYQIVVNEVIIDGKGELYLRFEELKKKLFEEGLFSLDKKRSLPNFPFYVGLITSPYGAAVRDFLKTALNKNPYIKVFVYSSKVQGEDAAKEVIDGIRYFNKKKEVDVIAIVRGGGSFEDLFPFNDEGLAYAIRESSIPIVTGIGHEIDYTIADYVADFRAATPTAAAESIVKGIDEIVEIIKDYKDRLDRSIVENILCKERVIRRFLNAFYKDKDRFDEKMELLSSYMGRLRESVRNILVNNHNKIVQLYMILERYSPLGLVGRFSERISLLELRQNGTILTYLELLRNRVNNNVIKLELLNPENILKKGYSIVYKDGNIVCDSDQVFVDDVLNVKFYKGCVKTIVKEKNK